MITTAVDAQSINDDNSGRQPYEIGLWGDLPYSTLQATVGVPNLIDDMNAQRLAFTVHGGDLKAGSGPCTNDVLAIAGAIATPRIARYNARLHRFHAHCRHDTS